MESKLSLSLSLSPGLSVSSTHLQLESAFNHWAPYNLMLELDYLLPFLVCRRRNLALHWLPLLGHCNNAGTASCLYSSPCAGHSCAIVLYSLRV